MIFSLIAIAILSDVAIPVRSEGLGVTAYTERTGIVRPDGSGRLMPPMLRVVEVEPGKPGASTGLKSGDMILGVTAYDVSTPENINYPPIVPEAFRRFPSTFVSGNTVQSILVYRPSLDSTAELHVNFSSKPSKPWPSGSLGVVVKDVPREAGIPAGMPRRKNWVEVVRVHPYSLADRLGILAGDVVVSVTVGGDVDANGLEKMPMSAMIEDVEGFGKILDLIRPDTRISAMTLTVARGAKTVRIAFPAARLR
jgi:S1-C subfamily serine protease